MWGLFSQGFAPPTHFEASSVSAFPAYLKYIPVCLFLIRDILILFVFSFGKGGFIIILF